MTTSALPDPHWFAWRNGRLTKDTKRAFRVRRRWDVLHRICSSRRKEGRLAKCNSPSHGLRTCSFPSRGSSHTDNEGIAARRGGCDCELKESAARDVARTASGSMSMLSLRSCGTPEKSNVIRDPGRIWLVGPGRSASIAGAFLWDSGRVKSVGML
jgi:hypothetical protein